MTRTGQETKCQRTRGPADQENHWTLEEIVFLILFFCDPVPSFLDPVLFPSTCRTGQPGTKLPTGEAACSESLEHHVGPRNAWRNIM